MTPKCMRQDYMRKAEGRIKEERQRAQNYLDACTQPRQMHIVQHELVQAHAITLVEMENSGAVAMFQDDKAMPLFARLRYFQF